VGFLGVEVEAVQHVVRIVQRAVDQDVGLDTLQDPDCRRASPYKWVKS
jgi:hypothetical protein